MKLEWHNMGLPDPKRVKPEQIIGIIEAFCKKWEERSNHVVMPGYCFEHVVLGDYNLYDDAIQFCLQPRVINRWLEDKLADQPLEHCDPTAAEPWRRWAYDAIIEYKDAAIEFLNWLLQIPEEVRDEAS